MDNYRVTFKINPTGRTEILATTEIREETEAEAIATLTYWMSQDFGIDEVDMDDEIILVSVELIK